MKSTIDGKAVVLEGSKNRYLVIADLHLGWHIKLAETTGAEFPSQDDMMLRELLVLIDKHNITNLYFLGDVKHSLGADVSFNWEAIPKFMDSLAREVDVAIVPGNHDGDLEALLPRDITLCTVRGTLLEEGDTSVGLVHGHAWPSKKVLRADMIFVGHNHPTLSNVRAVSSPNIHRAFRRRAKSIPVVLQSQLDRNCVQQKMNAPMKSNLPKCRLVTLPSFNQLVSGIPIDRPDAILRGPFFDNGCVQLEESEVYSTRGTYLGTVDFLQDRLVEMVK